MSKDSKIFIYWMIAVTIGGAALLVFTTSEDRVDWSNKAFPAFAVGMIWLMLYEISKLLKHVRDLLIEISKNLEKG